MAANKKSVTINGRIWAHVIRNDHITIKIASPDVGLISTVEGRSFGARSHKSLFPDQGRAVS
jgi:hypothetical protein